MFRARNGQARVHSPALGDAIAIALDDPSSYVGARLARRAATVTPMGMRWDRCWFEKCRDPGTMVDIDGEHPRSLCGKHADGLRKALAMPGTVRVSWGRSKKEILADLTSRLRTLQAQHAVAEAALDAHRARPVDLDEFGLEPDDDEGKRLDRAEWYASVDLSLVEEEIGQVGARTWDHPIVRVHVNHG